MLAQVLLVRRIYMNVKADGPVPTRKTYLTIPNLS
jgi:hypothetical protein